MFLALWEELRKLTLASRLLSWILSTCITIKYKRSLVYVSQIESGYFVVWTEKDLHIEQIMFDNNMWKEICEKSRHIFVTAILPELVGKFYSRLPFSQPLSSVENNVKPKVKSRENTEELWCFCAQVESGSMICCDNEECPIQWYHYLCLGISCAPRGKWYCPDCRKLSKFRPKRGHKKVSV